MALIFLGDCFSDSGICYNRYAVSPDILNQPGNQIRTSPHLDIESSGEISTGIDRIKEHRAILKIPGYNGVGLSSCPFPLQLNHIYFQDHRILQVTVLNSKFFSIIPGFSIESFIEVKLSLLDRPYSLTSNLLFTASPNSGN